MLDSLIDAKFPRLYPAIAVLLGVICPSSLGIAFFTPTFFSQVDTGKLVLIAAAVGGVPLALNLWPIYRMFWRADPKALTDVNWEGVFSVGVTVAAVLSTVPLYAPTLLFCMFDYRAPRVALLVAAVIEAIIFSVLWVLCWWFAPCTAEENAAPVPEDQSAVATE